MKQFPLISLLCTLFVLRVSALPESAEFLQWDRLAISKGEIWRILGGHFTHWTPSHLSWDLAAFLPLACIAELWSRKTFLITLSTTAIFSHFALVCFSQYECYRGLSAFDTALFSSLLILYSKRSLDNKDLSGILISLAALFCLGLKLVLETTRSEPLFSGSLGEGISVASITHLAGLLAAFATSIFFTWLKPNSHTKGSLAKPALASSPSILQSQTKRKRYGDHTHTFSKAHSQSGEQKTAIQSIDFGRRQALRLQGISQS